MSIFENPYLVLPFSSLIIQIVVLFLLAYGLFLKQKLKYRLHGVIMALAVVLHLTTILAIMIQSFGFFMSYYIVPAPLDAISIVGLIHGISGSVAFVLGVFLVAAWGLRKDVNGCFKRKKVMRITIALWFVALVLGIALFAIFYGPTIFG